jgi:serine/threonine-protein kinase
MEGRTLLHYEIREKLGQGGMGAVYKARDTRLGRAVAIKILPPAESADPKGRARFLREARAASALNHPNIVTVYEVGAAEGIDFIAMEYIAGRTLAGLLAAQGLAPGVVFRYGLQMADALAQAHGAGIIHRDLKPGNVMITESGLVKILDFGLAKIFWSERGEDDQTATVEAPLTAAGAIFGTINYMSPEQASGKEVSVHSDVFSFGIILYQMITGVHPFDAKNQLATLSNIISVNPVPIRELRRDAPVELERAVHLALEKDPRERPTMAELRDDLERAARLSTSWLDVATSIPSTPPAGHASGGSRSSRSLRLHLRRKRRRYLIAATSLAALAAALVPFTLWNFGTGRPTPLTRSAGASFEQYQKGRKLLERPDRKGNVEEAIETFTAAVDSNPDSAAAYAGLADAYHAMNNLNRDPQWIRMARDAARKGVQLNPDLAVARVALGKVEMASGDNGKAETELLRALEIDNRNAAAHRWLGAIYAFRDESDKAEEYYRRAMELAPAEWQPASELGVYLFKKAKYAEAVDLWSQAVRLAPDHSMLYRNLAGAYHMLDRTDDAATQLQKALEIEPTPPAYNNLGTLRYFQGRYPEAVRAFEKAVELRGDHYLYWGNLGDAYRWSPGLKEKAPPAYARAIELARERLAAKPDDVDLRSSLAVYHVKKGDAASARHEIEQAGKQPRRTAGSYFKEGVVRELLGEREGAIQALAKAIGAGYAMREIREEPELSSLRGDQRIQLLMSKTTR